MTTELIPIVDEVVEVLEAVVDVVVRERSCNVEDTERPSRGGKRPFGPLVSSEKFSSSSSGEPPLPTTNSVDSGYTRIVKKGSLSRLSSKRKVDGPFERFVASEVGLPVGPQ